MKEGEKMKRKTRKSTNNKRNSKLKKKKKTKSTMSMIALACSRGIPRERKENAALKKRKMNRRKGVNHPLPQSSLDFFIRRYQFSLSWNRL